MKVQAKELTDATVSHISLVDRGANREPFRIIKAQGDTDMLDFSKGFKGLFQKSEVRGPAIVAVAFAKSWDPKAAAELLGDAGMTFADAVLSDDALTFPIAGATDMEGTVVYKLDNDVAIAVRFDEPELVLKGYSGYDFESTDYKSVLGTNTLLPMIGVAMSALQDTIYNVMSNSDTVEVAKGDIKKVLKDFGAVVMEITDRVPATAFKLEAAVSKVVTAKADNKGQTGDTEKTEAEKLAEEAEVVAPAGTEAAAAGGEADAEAAGAEGAEADGEKVEVQKGEEAPADATLAAIQKMLEPLGAQVASLGENIRKQGDDLAALGTQVGTLQTSVKKMDEELGTGVLGGESGGDAPVTITKADVGLADDEDGDEDGFLILDTGYSDPFSDMRKKK